MFWFMKSLVHEWEDADKWIAELEAWAIQICLPDWPRDAKFCSETLRGKFATCHITIMSIPYFPAFTEHVEDAHELFRQILIDAV